jgi:hypothetical protein
MSAKSKPSGLRRGLVFSAALIAAGTLVSTAQGAVLANSAFNSGTEGWKVVGDTGGGTDVPTFSASGGDPGGYVSINDGVTGGVMYWRAPAPYRMVADDAYAGSLSFSLQQSQANNPFDDEDVILKGGGVNLTYDLSDDPPLTPVWGKYKVRLVKAGWVRTASGRPATADDMKNVLASLSSLTIRAEYENGPDTDGLDSVSLRSKNVP